uniref:Uncharacterized protein n=1 Tax=Arundo donax TaxID=35708 RepID=A0A0A9AD19_ARUDO
MYLFGIDDASDIRTCVLAAQVRKHLDWADDSFLVGHLSRELVPTVSYYKRY